MTARPSAANLAATARAFSTEFARFAGRRGLVAVVAAGLVTVSEALGLLLIIPLAAMITGQALPLQLGQLLQVMTLGHGDIAAANGLAWLVSIALIILGVRAACTWVRDLTLGGLQVGFVQTLRSQLTTAVAQANWPTLVKLDHAALTQILSGDLQRCGAAAQFLSQALVSFVLLAGQLLLAFVLSPTITALVIILAALAAVAMAPQIAAARRLGQAVTTNNATLAEETSRFLGGLKLAISHGRQGDFLRRTDAAASDLASRQMAFLRQQSETRIAMTTGSALAAVLILLIGHGVLHIAAPVLFTLLAIIARISGPLMSVQQSLVQLGHALPAWEAIRSVRQALDATPITVAVPAPKSATTAVDAWAPIRFENVTYRHGETPDSGGVTGLSFEIKPRALAGLIGPSGSGKTTTADLISGLLTPQTGRISVAGLDLTPARLDAWRAGLAYVPQDLFLLHDTVRANLLWGRSIHDDKSLWAALDVVGAAHLVSSLERGLDTPVGERGVRLSGGERQRLILARALLLQPQLLILDEALSALPQADEAQIISDLRRNYGELTIVLITHRTQTASLCDQQLVFATDPSASSP